MAWIFAQMFSSKYASSLFRILFPNENPIISQTASELMVKLVTDRFYPESLDSMFVPYMNGSVVAWFLDMLECVTTLSNFLPYFGITNLWIPRAFYNIDVSFINAHTPDSWSHRIEDLNSVVYGDSMHTMRTCISIIRNGTINIYNPTTSTPLLDTVVIGYGSHIEVSYNSTLDYEAISLPVDLLANADKSISNVSHHSLFIV